MIRMCVVQLMLGAIENVFNLRINRLMIAIIFFLLGFWITVYTAIILNAVIYERFVIHTQIQSFCADVSVVSSNCCSFSPNLQQFEHHFSAHIFPRLKWWGPPHRKIMRNSIKIYQCINFNNRRTPFDLRTKTKIE